MNISPQMIAPAAQAGVELFQLRTTLIPGDLKSQITVLEAVLMSITTGSLIVVPAPKPDVELPDKVPGPSGEGKGQPEKEPDNASLREAVKTQIEAGRNSTEPRLPETDASVAPGDSSDRSDGSSGSAAESGS
jgi:hypothetical protein